VIVRIFHIAALLALTFLFSCGGGGQQCLYTSDCPEGNICTETGVCAVAECADNSQCGIGSYCGDSHVCTAGCSEDLDCDAGKTCNVETHECNAYGCRTTQLDCALGQFCDTDSGQCLDDERGHCDVCDATAINPNCAQGQGTCVVWDIGDPCNNDNQCDTDWTCDPFDLFSSSCHVDRCLGLLNGASLNCPTDSQVFEAP
jgi:hypothetical protein